MGAAAEFGREIANPDDAYLVAIFLPEQGHCLVFIDGDVYGYIFDHLDLFVSQHFLVDQVFDVLQFLVFDGREVRKVEAQVIGRD